MITENKSLHILKHTNQIMKTKKARPIIQNDSVFSRGGEVPFPYLPPEICVCKIGIESGFASSITLGTSDDSDLPQIGDIDDWEEWD